MRTFKLINSLVVVLVFSALSVATASAAETLWKWLPGAKGTTFTAKSGKATLRIEGFGSIECVRSESTSGELTEPNGDATLSFAVISFKGCKAFGLEPVLSLGLNKEEIVTRIEMHNCIIKAKDFGLLIKPLPLHIEFQATSLLVVVEGSFVGLAEPLPTDLKHWALNIKAESKTAKQEIKLCEGGAEESLSGLVDAEKAPVKASMEALEALMLFISTNEDPT